MARLKLVILALLATSGSDGNAAGRHYPYRRFSPVISFNLNEQDTFNRTVRIAAREGDLDRLQEALKAGGLIDSRSGRGVTALMNAARNCRPEALQLLIERGADVNLRENHGRTALMFAASGGCLPAVKLLLDARARVRVRDKTRKSAYDYARSAAALEVDGPALRALKLIRARWRDERDHSRGDRSDQRTR